VADEFEKWKLRWVDVGDGRVCPDCISRRKWSAVTLSEWEERGLPGAGWTYCQGNCRCILIPDGLLEVVPTLRGKGISLRDDENLKISKEINYKLYRDLDNLVAEWESVTNDANLPDEYYGIGDVKKRIEFLKRAIHGLGKPPVGDKK
jgi:hypothetical protein